MPIEGAITQTITRSAIIVQTTLICVNVILAVRGVKVWQVIKRFRVERWIREIARSPLPGVVRVSSWVGRAFRPLKLPLRPFAAMRAARQARIRKAAELQAKVEADAKPVLGMLIRAHGFVTSHALKLRIHL